MRALMVLVQWSEAQAEYDDRPPRPKGSQDAGLSYELSLNLKTPRAVQHNRKSLGRTQPSARPCRRAKTYSALT